MKRYLFLSHLFGFFLLLSFNQINGVIFSVARELARGTCKQEIRTSLKNLCPQKVVKKINKSMTNDSLCSVFNSIDGEYLLKMIKLGDVPGSYAIYYVRINAEGKTVEVVKDTFDNKKRFVHRKIKKAESE